MRRINEIKDLPVSQLSDEEICKAAMHRLGSKMCCLIYRGDDGKIYWCTRWRDKIGRAYWSKIEIMVHRLFNRVFTKIGERFDF
jgi:hypothetical protein